MTQQVVPFLFLSVASIGFFTFIAVAKWASERRREREAYYLSETLKKMADSPGAGSNSAIEVLRAEESIELRRRREGHKLAGIVTVAVGVSMMVFIGLVDRKNTEPDYLVGLIPLFVGISLLMYVYVLGPKK